MLYVSTRNVSETYTAYRATHEENAPDGGQYVPFYLPKFTDKEINTFKSLGFSDAVAQVLNLFFSLRLSKSEVVSAIGHQPVKTVALGQRLIIEEMWHNSIRSCEYLIQELYSIMTENSALPAGWPCIAIKVALLFGIYTMLEGHTKDFDIAVSADDYSDLTAILYAKNMGLPINLSICACNENNSTWDFVNKGEFTTGIEQPKYMESFLYKLFSAQEVKRYLDACQRKTLYCIDANQLEVLNNTIFAAVVSKNRVDSIISSTFHTNQYHMDSQAAQAYGSLQDYRSQTGISNQTLAFAKKRPNGAKE